MLYNNKRVNHDLRKVVAILPYRENKVLMQLRDENADIFPECWGFFSGSVENDENIEDAARRELFEEIGYKPNALRYLSKDCYLDLGIISYAYYCRLNIPINKIALGEGVDFTLVSVQEVKSNSIYSKKLDRYFPVTAAPLVLETIRKLWNTLGVA